MTGRLFVEGWCDVVLGRCAVIVISVAFVAYLVRAAGDISQREFDVLSRRPWSEGPPRAGAERKGAGR